MFGYRIKEDSMNKTKYSIIALLLIFLFVPLFAIDTLNCIANYELTPPIPEQKYMNIKKLGDINTDGFEDWAYIFYNGYSYSPIDLIYVFLGSDTIDFTMDHSLNGSDIASIGDVNGDGIDDIAFQRLNISGDYFDSEPILYILYGGSSFDYIPDDSCLVDARGRVGDLSPIGTLGDINGDGYDDIYSGLSYKINSTGAARQSIHLGSTNISFEPDTILYPPNRVDTVLMYDYHWGHFYAPLGDINEDGFDDFAVMYDDLPYDSEEYRVVYVYYGNSSLDSIVASADTLIYQDNYRSFTHSKQIDNDGITLFLGHPLHYIDFYHVTDSIPILHFEHVLETTTNTGDINNDGYSDWMFQLTDPKFFAGYYGNSILDTIFDCLLPVNEQPAEHSQHYLQSAFIGDVCGDGYDKIIVLESSERYFPSNSNTYHVYCYSYNEVLTGTASLKPNTFTLSQNRPNPANPTTTISYELPEAQNITLQIFDITGRLVETLYKGYKEAGHWDLKWNASEQSSGVYIYRLQVGDRCISKKMVVLK
jgi:hypothetical protein